MTESCRSRDLISCYKAETDAGESWRGSEDIVQPSAPLESQLFPGSPLVSGVAGIKVGAFHLEHSSASPPGRAELRGVGWLLLLLNASFWNGIIKHC